MRSFVILYVILHVAWNKYELVSAHELGRRIYSIYLDFSLRLLACVSISIYRNLRSSDRLFVRPLDKCKVMPS